MEEVKKFLDREGRVKIWPTKIRLKLLVLKYLSGYFEENRKYSEKEVNNVLNEHHTFGDPASLRRELCDYKFLNRTRDCREYWKEKDKNFI